MASSTSGKGKEAATSSIPSSVNGLRNLLANEMEDTDQAEKIDRQAQKLRLADNARLMQDNQQILDTSVAEDRALRQQRHRFREMQLRKMEAEANGSRIRFPEGGDMGDIKIDSPTEIHHHHAPPPSSPGMGTGAKVALATAAILAGTLGGAGLGYLLTPKPEKPLAPVNTTVEKTEGFRIKLVEPNGAKP